MIFFAIGFIAIMAVGISAAFFAVNKSKKDIQWSDNTDKSKSYEDFKRQSDMALWWK